MALMYLCLLYTSDAADEGLGVDLGGRRIIKKKIKEGSVEVVGVFVFWFFSFCSFFFFKQKTAYEIRLSLVGSEMCIRDRIQVYLN